ncbi:hypothetical protein J2W43_000781 [Pseudomonas brassicacearum]|uniref:Uncharacterized protein n=1 Tax=Pseudomonas brassicacearum TaxID=930166 RepID=A0AAW8M504_9PSED|nr:hypothetical protein [Pseudomonas brassicacearum]
MNDIAIVSGNPLFTPGSIYLGQIKPGQTGKIVMNQVKIEVQKEPSQKT